MKKQPQGLEAAKKKLIDEIVIYKIVLIYEEKVEYINVLLGKKGSPAFVKKIKSAFANISNKDTKYFSTAKLLDLAVSKIL